MIELWVAPTLQISPATPQRVEEQPSVKREFPVNFVHSGKQSNQHPK